MAWAGSNAGPCQAGDHGSEIVSAIETVFELREVARHMLTADGAVGADDGGLDIAEGRIDPPECRDWNRAC